MHDLEDVIDEKDGMILNFADDQILLSKDKSGSKKNLEKLLEYSKSNKIILNLKKCSFMYKGWSKEEKKVDVGLEETTNFRYLGLQVNKLLDSSLHFEKAKSTMKLLKRAWFAVLKNSSLRLRNNLFHLLMMPRLQMLFAIYGVSKSTERGKITSGIRAMFKSWMGWKASLSVDFTNEVFGQDIEERFKRKFEKEKETLRVRCGEFIEWVKVEKKEKDDKIEDTEARNKVVKREKRSKDRNWKNIGLIGRMMNWINVAKCKLHKCRCSLEHMKMHFYKDQWKMLNDWNSGLGLEKPADFIYKLFVFVKV